MKDVDLREVFSDLGLKLSVYVSLFVRDSKNCILLFGSSETAYA